MGTGGKVCVMCGQQKSLGWDWPDKKLCYDCKYPTASDSIKVIL